MRRRRFQLTLGPLQRVRARASGSAKELMMLMMIHPEASFAKSSPRTASAPTKKTNSTRAVQKAYRGVSLIKLGALAPARARAQSNTGKGERQIIIVTPDSVQAVSPSKRLDASSLRIDNFAKIVSRFWASKKRPPATPTTRGSLSLSGGGGKLQPVTCFSFPHPA